jgi:hypothetical protein
MLPTRLRELWPPLVARLPSSEGYQSLDWKLKRFLGRWDDDPLQRHLRWMSAVDLPELAAALPLWKGAPAALGHELPPAAEGLNRLLALDFGTYLPGSVLAKVDRAAMAHGLEVRPPFLHGALVDRLGILPAFVAQAQARPEQVLAQEGSPGARPRRDHRAQEARLQHPTRGLAARPAASNGGGVAPLLAALGRRAPPADLRGLVPGAPGPQGRPRQGPLGTRGPRSMGATRAHRGRRGLTPRPPLRSRLAIGGFLSKEARPLGNSGLVPCARTPFGSSSRALVSSPELEREVR